MLDDLMRGETLDAAVQGHRSALCLNQRIGLDRHRSRDTRHRCASEQAFRLAAVSATASGGRRPTRRPG